MAVADKALCLQGDESHPAIRAATTLSAAIGAACLELCRGRPDLLAHAYVASPAGPLRPLGKLFGEEAVDHGALAGVLCRVADNGTVFTSAVLRLGRPVWTNSIPHFGWRGLAQALRAHGVRSGGGFPFVVGNRLGAVVELLCFDDLSCDLASEALAAELADQVAARFAAPA